ncbi:unnamed protein product [Laminaria digitata]
MPRVKTCAKVTLLTSLLIGALSTPAWAQDDKAKARTYYEEGVKAAYAGNYGEAIFQFKQGYKLDPNGLFPYNITIAYLKTKNYEDALRFAVEAESRSKDLDQKQRTRNQARISSLSIRKSTLRVADDIKDLQSKTVVKKGPEVTDPGKETERSGIGPLGWGGVTLTMLGGGLMGSSLYFNNKLKGYINEDGNTPPELEAEAVQARTTGLALLIAGGAVTLTGIGMFVYALGSRNSGKASLMLAPARGGGYMGMSVRF